MTSWGDTLHATQYAAYPGTTCFKLSAKQFNCTLIPMTTAVLQQQPEAALNGQPKVKVFVSGCYDILHGGRILLNHSSCCDSSQVQPEHHQAVWCYV
jgi:hypothetical protein